MWAYTVIGFFCLSGLCYALDNVQQIPQRSCDLNQGTVCIPAACSKNVCSLWKNAVCVDDRCGCEARFFNWMANEKTFQDVSKMCSSANFVINFANFTSEKKENDEAAAASPSDATILKYFKEFNLLTTELLTDIADYLKAVSEASPTQANIDKLSMARRALSTLKRTGRVFAESDRLSSKGLWGAAKEIFGDTPNTRRKVELALQSDELSEKGIWGALKEVFGDAEAQDTETLSGKGLWGAAKEIFGDTPATRKKFESAVKIDELTGKGIWGALKEVFADSEADRLKLGPNALKNYKTNYAVLQDIISDKGSYADAVNSGNVAISDKNAKKVLQMSARDVCLNVLGFKIGVCS